MRNATQKLLSFILKYRVFSALSVVLITLFCGAKLSQLKIYNELDLWFNSEDLVFQEYVDYKNHFGEDRTLIVAYQSDALFSEEELAMSRALSDSLKNIEGIQSVVSLTNFRIPRITPLGTYLTRLIPKKPNDYELLKQQLTQQSIFIDNLISKHGDATVFQLIPEDSVDFHKTYYRTKSILNQYFQDKDFIVVGGMAITVKAEEVSSVEPPAFLLTAVVIIIILLTIVFKRFVFAIIPILIAILSIVWTLALLGSFSGSINMITGIIPLILLATSIAFTIHFTTRFLKFRSSGLAPKQSIEKSMQEIILPGTIASFTTSAAFAAFAFSDILPVQHFGIFTAVGILIALVLSIVLLPIFFSYMKHAKPQSIATPLSSSFSNHIAAFVERHRKVIVLLSAVILIFSAWGITKVQSQSDQIKYFKKSSELRISNGKAGTWFGGIYPFELIFNLEDVPKDSMPLVLKQLSDIETKLLAVEQVKVCHSVDGFLNAIVNLNNGIISKQLIIQSLLSSKKNKALSKGMNHFVSNDFSRYRITVRTPWIDNESANKVVRRIKETVDSNMRGKAIPYYISGTAPMYLYLNTKVMKAQRFSITFSFAIIFIVLIFSFKKPLLFMAGILPNLFPVLNTLGLMGFLNIPIDVGTVLIASVSLGIAVDDTIYFLNAYKCNAQTMNPLQAIENSYSQVWKSLFLTTSVLITGFIIMVFSGYSPVIYLGVFVSLNLFLALLYDTVALPAILLVFANRKK